MLKLKTFLSGKQGAIKLNFCKICCPEHDTLVCPIINASSCNSCQWIINYLKYLGSKSTSKVVSDSSPRKMPFFFLKAHK